MLLPHGMITKFKSVIIKLLILPKRYKYIKIKNSVVNNNAKLIFGIKDTKTKKKLKNIITMRGYIIYIFKNLNFISFFI